MKRLEDLQERLRELGELAKQRASSKDRDHEEMWLDLIEETMNLVYSDIERIRAERARSELLGGLDVVDLKTAVAHSLKDARNYAGWTQQQLADAMVRLGFVTWKRITVAETESGKRRPSWEELLGYAVLFGCPVAFFLTDLPYAGVLTDHPLAAVPLNERVTLTGLEVTELITGEAEAGGASYDKALASSLTVTGVEQPLSEDDWRPVADIHRRRRAARQPPYEETR